MRFAQPQVLWILLAVLPALVGFLYWSWRVKQKLILQFVHSRLLAGLTIGVSPRRQKLRLTLLVAAVAGVLLALARPQWGFAWEEAKMQGLDIIVAIDTSRSMLAQDVAPNRLEKAKLAAIDLMRLAKTDRLGLVAFAGTAFLQAPLTVDEQAFEQAVDAVSVGIIPQGGTALSAAISTAADAFERGNDNHKVLVLFTDGEDHDADTETLAATKEAADAGVRIFTIGVGTPEGELLRAKDEDGNMTYIKDEDGNVVKSHLNQTLLQKIATEANGFYLPLQGANPMDTLYSRGLAPLPKSEESTRLTRVYQERFYWPLGFAILCLVAELLLPESPRSRRPAVGVLQKAAAIFVFLLLPMASVASPSSAYRDYQSGDFKAALDEYNRLAEKNTNDYRLHYDAGAAAYRAKEMERAQKQFNEALNSQGIISDPRTQEHTYYNLGNTLYQLGEPLPDPDKKKQLWEQAIENLGHAYKLDTNDIDARNNLAYVRQKLEQLKQQQQQQQNQKQDQKDNKDQKDQQNQQNQNDKQKQDQNKKNDKQGEQQNQKDSQSQQADQKKADQEKAKQEQAKKEADKEKQQQQAQANSSDKRDKNAENAEPTAMAEATMSQQEARQLLESQQENEKILIFAPDNKPPRNPSAKVKDW